MLAVCVLLLIWHLSNFTNVGETSPTSSGHEKAIQPSPSQTQAADIQPYRPELEKTPSHQQGPSLAGQEHVFRNPVKEFIPLPKATAILLRVQHDFPPESAAAKELRERRLGCIKEAMLHSWEGYRDNAWAKDELAPMTGGSKTTLSGWGATMVDALDTLWLMGLKAEFEHAVQAIAKIDFSTPAQLPINVFETTIRYLGGLLGAYDVSGGKYPVLLQKAKEVGDMLYVAFDTPTHMPVLRWSKIGVEVAAGDALIAELGSLSLEFTRLTQLTGDAKFHDAIQRISDCLEGQQSQTKVPGLFPHTVNARECYFGDGVTFSIGGSADSVYEYFPKQHQLLRGGTSQYKKMYQSAIEPMKKFLLFRPMTPTHEDMLMAGTFKAFRPDKSELIPQVQHLSCFAGGMFALGAKLFDSPTDLDTAWRLVRGCVWAYNQTVTGIMPDMFHVVPCPDNALQCDWDEKAWADDVAQRNSNNESPDDKLRLDDGMLDQQAVRLPFPKGMSSIPNRRYELRPEAIESIFVLYRITADESLREIGWQMFEAITNHTRTKLGFSAIQDVTKLGSWKVDRMESYWMGETLKYFWLLFAEPGLVSLDEFVFNTEAHPFRWQTTPTV